MVVEAEVEVEVDELCKFTWFTSRAFPDGLQQTVFPRIPMGIPSAQQSRLQQTVFPWEYIPLHTVTFAKSEKTL